VPATRQRSTVELRLVAVGPDRAPHDVRVEAAPDARARELAAVLAAQIGVDGEPALTRSGGEVLPADAPVAELGLRQGEELFFDSYRAVSAARSRLALAVVGGPEAGRRFALPPGVHRVGRDAAIRIDDPSLSGQHLVLSVPVDGRVSVADAGSRNGTMVEGVTLAAGEERPLRDGEVVQAGRTLLAVQAQAEDEPPLHGDGAGLVAFNRPPRVQRPLEPATKPFPAPPGDPQRPRIPMGASLIPLVLGIGLYLLTKLPTMLFFSLLAPVMAVSTYIEDRRGGRKGFERSARDYRGRVAELRNELEEERREEAARRRAHAPSAPELLRRAARHEPTLWERRVGDRDFLALRVGSAEQPSLFSISLEQGGNEDLRKQVEAVSSWYATVPAVPVTAPLAELGVVGLAGSHARVTALARWLVSQAAALHSPRDLTIALALADRDESWEWVKWLPHTQPGGVLGAPAAGNPRAARRLLEDVARLVAARRLDAEATFGGASRRARPHVLLVVDEAVAPERALVADVLRDGRDLAVSVLWLGRDRRDLPGDCAGIVELAEESARLTYTDVRSGDEISDAAGDGLAVDLARGLALLLAPLRDAGAGESEGIPDRVALVDLLDADDVDAEWVARRWEDLRAGLEAVLGAAAGGPFSVDLRADGPHALVAGMTGAGKSELLQTLIASLAANHPPHRLSFLLVDYKGGAAFKDCVRLPHTVGLVTDLDAHLTQRALASLNAELQRRERILRDAAAKDLAELERRDPAAAPASLVIVIDEFATLAKEVPDFIEGIVDVAQRGRSLGVHLVLATQRPGGVVSENIRANTNLRIALRVNEAAESGDVIGAPDAARIPRDRPGRAYARTGHSELTELQTAYVSGATVHVSADAPVVVQPFTLAPAAATTAAESGDETDLARLVAAAATAATEGGIESAPSPWLPPLGTSVALEDLPPTDGAAVAVGIVDEPQRQLQRPLALDLEADGSVLVYGASGSGKTTFMRTLTLALAEREPPPELHVYALDFATRALAPLAALPHCGAVIGAEDEERVERLFAFLRRTLERRKELFAQAGVFSLSEYRRVAGAEPAPRIVVLLDGYSGFAAAFERVNLGELVDALPRLVGDGRPLGIHFVISADRRGGVPNALSGIVPTKIVLRMADEDEFAALGVPPKAVRGAHLPPGRGFLPGGTELQIAHELDLSQRADELRARYPERLAPGIEPLPLSVPRASLTTPEQPWEAVPGLADAELEPVTISLADRHFLVVGPYRSGRSTALRTIVESLRASTPDLDMHLVAPRRTPLLDLPFWATVAEGEQCDEASLRLGELVAGGLERPALVVIDDGDELAESLGAAPLETVVRRGRDLPIRVLAASERQAAQRAFAGWLRELRKEEHGLLLDPDPDVDGDILGTRLPRRSNPVFPPGRGYLVERGLVELVQIAL
jgi:S-DNA-T family DNA segregation ATPase FtsK/SpoIIIE